MAQALRTTADLLELWQRDILAWCEDNLGQLPREWQPDVLAAIAALLWNKGQVSAAIVACRKAGKTRAAAILVLWFMDTRPDCLVVTIAPVWSQVIQNIWPQIRYLWANSSLPLRRPNWQILTHEIQTDSPLWRAYGMAARDPQNLEGRHSDTAVLVIVDEAKAVSEEIRNSISGMLWEDGRESLLVAIGTPGAPAGWFYRAFANERAAWDVVRKVRADEIPRLAKRCELERQRLGDSNPWFLQQQLAEFAGADEFSIFPLHLIQRAQTLEAAERCARLFPRPSRTMALDPAGRGADDSVLSFRLGGTLSGQQAWQGWDEMRTAVYTAGQAREWRPEIVVVDEIGIGAGIRSRIAELLGANRSGRSPLRSRPTNIRVLGYNAGSKARDRERFANRKTEDLFRLRERFEAGEVSLPEDAPLLTQQLCSYRWKSTTGGKTAVEDPEDSPDYADSYLMTYASERVGGVRAFSPRWA